MATTLTAKDPRPKPDRVDLRLRLWASSHSVEGRALRYLSQSQHLSAAQMRERVIDAVCLLWLPYACQELQEGDSKQAARETINQLERHIDRIRRDFGLLCEGEPRAIAIGPMAVPSIVQSSESTTPPATSALPPPPDLDLSFYDSLSVFEN